jgi:hypothetical protein
VAIVAVHFPAEQFTDAIAGALAATSAATTAKTAAVSDADRIPGIRPSAHGIRSRTCDIRRSAMTSPPLGCAEPLTC